VNEGIGCDLEHFE